MAIIIKGLTQIGTFLPTKISGLQLWLDASDSSTLFQDSNGTTPAMADGDPIGCWKDKSGNGYNVIQTDGTNKPSLSIAAKKGKNVISFDGTNDYLNGGDILDMRLNNLSYFAVCKFNVIDSNNNVVLSKSAYTSFAGRYNLIRLSNQLWSLFHDNEERNAVATFSSTSWSVLSSVIVRGGGLNSLYSGENLIASTTTGSLVQDLNTSFSFLVGADNSSSFVPWTFNVMNGKISEILFYNRDITSNERLQINSYLSSKWGIT